MAIDTYVDVAIVGGGVCGLAVLVELVDRESKGTRIALIEKRSSIGPGLAFSEACVGTRVNVDARTMGFYTTDPDHFEKWMKQNPGVPSGEEYPPREYFGRYLLSVTDTVMQQAKDKDITVIVYQDEAVDMEKLEHGWSIRLQSGTPVYATQVSLALGNQMSQVYKHLNGIPLYFGNPWPNNRLLTIPKKASIAIIGSQLTAIDEALFLYDHGYTGQIYLLSRSGQLPKVQAKGFKRPDRAYRTWTLAREVEQNPLGAIVTIARRLHDEITTSCQDEKGSWAQSAQTHDVLSIFRRDVQAARSGNVPAYAILRETAFVIERYWQCMDEFSQRAFLKEYMSMWTKHRFAMPLRTGERLLNLLESGQLRVLRINTKQSITHSENNFSVPVATAAGTIEVDALIEATGMEYNATRITTPLMRNLLRRNILRPHHNGGVHCDSLTLKVDKGLYILGSMTRGVHFYSTSVDRNIPHAGRLVDSMLGLPSRKPLHIALYIGRDVYSNLILSAVIPHLVAAGHLPFIYLSSSRRQDDNQPFERSEDNLYDEILLQNTIAPYLGSTATGIGKSLTAPQLKTRYGVLVQTVSDVNEADYINSLSTNYLDMAFDIRSDHHFGATVTTHFAKRQGLYHVQTVRGDNQLGYALHDLSKKTQAGDVVNVQTNTTDPSAHLLNAQDSIWHLAVDMIISQTDTMARGVPTKSCSSLPSSLIPCATTTLSLSSPTQSSPILDTDAMKTTLVKHFAPDGQKAVLGTAIETACRAWYKANAEKQGEAFDLDRSAGAATLVNCTPVHTSERSSMTGSARIEDIGFGVKNVVLVAETSVGDDALSEESTAPAKIRGRMRARWASWTRSWKADAAVSRV